jgi:hypothetical protein
MRSRGRREKKRETKKKKAEGEGLSFFLLSFFLSPFSPPLFPSSFLSPPDDKRRTRGCQKQRRSGEQQNQGAERWSLLKRGHFFVFFFGGFRI